MAAWTFLIYLAINKNKPFYSRVYKIWEFISMSTEGVVFGRDALSGTLSWLVNILLLHNPVFHMVNQIQWLQKHSSAIRAGCLLIGLIKMVSF